MPALRQEEYDYYEYARQNRGTAYTAPRVRASSRTSTSRATSARNRVNNSQAETRRIQSGVKTNTATRNFGATRNTTVRNTRTATTSKSTAQRAKTSTRSNVKTTTTLAATQKRRNTSKNIEVPSFVGTRKIEKPKEMTLKKPKSNVKPAMKKGSLVRGFVFSFFAFSILFLISYRSSVINESFNELNDLKGELDDITTLNAQLESDIQTETNISYIETYAKYQLGMQKPKDSQIHRISVDKRDKISTPVVIEEEEESFFENLLNDILNILD